MGILFTHELKEVENQTFSPTISDAVCVLLPMLSEMRQEPESPDSDSWGMVKCDAGNESAGDKGSFYLREQPVTPIFPSLIFAVEFGVSASRMRSMPQAQDIVAPAEWEDPYRV